MQQDFLKVGQKVIWVNGWFRRIATISKINPDSVDIEFKGGNCFIYTVSVDARYLIATKEA